MKPIIFVRMTIFFICIVMTACSAQSVYVTKTYKYPEFEGKKYSSILVVAASNDLKRRQAFEEIFADESKRKGMKAVPSFLVVGIGATLSKATLEDAARKTGADCVLVTRLVAINKETHTEPGAVHYDLVPVYGAPDPDGPNPDEGVFYTETLVREQPLVTTHLNVSLQTSLFDVATGRLGWYALTSSGEVDDLNKAIKQYADAIITALSHSGVFASGY
jgi:hypothetical protein